MKLKLGVYFEIGEYDADDPMQMNRARLIVNEIKEIAAGRVAPDRPQAIGRTNNDPWQKTVSDSIRRETLAAMEATGWDLQFAARKLGISDLAIRQRLIKYRGQGLVRHLGKNRWCPVANVLEEKHHSLGQG